MPENPQTEPKGQAGAGSAEADAAQASDQAASATPTTSAQPPAWTVEDQAIMRQRAHASYRRRSG